MIRVEGEVGISATVLADSVSTVDGQRITTFELTYPRIIHSELMTHRMLSKNAASSRAIPFDKMQAQLTGRPVRFGQANPGMQDKGENYDALVDIGAALHFSHPFMLPADEAWDAAIESATRYSKAFHHAGFHKQVYNRLTEAGQMMKTVMTGTEWNNFFWLRDDGSADPTIAELARVMKSAREQSTPLPLHPGEWHLTYIDTVRLDNGKLKYSIIEVEDGVGKTIELSTEEAKAVSAARSAAVSFRNVDYGVIKSEQVFARLVGEDRKHASAFEHQATPMAAYSYHPVETNWPRYPHTWEDGISHMDKELNLWSGNFKGWIQHRKLIPDENKEG